MDNKPFHYDGSLQTNQSLDMSEESNTTVEITDEMRKSIGTNPYNLQNS